MSTEDPTYNNLTIELEGVNTRLIKNYLEPLALNDDIVRFKLEIESRGSIFAPPETETTDEAGESIETDADTDDPEPADADDDESENPDDLVRIEFASRSAAKAWRQSNEDALAEHDDRRLKVVSLRPDANGAIESARAAAEKSKEIAARETPTEDDDKGDETPAETNGDREHVTAKLLRPDDTDDDSPARDYLDAIDDDEDPDPEEIAPITLNPDTQRYYVMGLLYRAQGALTTRTMYELLEGTPWETDKNALSAALTPLLKAGVVDKIERQGQRWPAYQLSQLGRDLMYKQVNEKPGYHLTIADKVTKKHPNIPTNQAKA